VNDRVLIDLAGVEPCRAEIRTVRDVRGIPRFETKCRERRVTGGLRRKKLAGVEMKTGLGGANVEATAGRRIPKRRDRPRHGGFSTDNQRMVITAADRDRRVTDALADGMRLAKVERRPADAASFTGRDA